MNNINKYNTHIISKPFNLYQPKTIEEAVKLLSKHKKARILAGGTDLIPKMKQRILEPRNLINIKKIPSLKGIKETKKGIWIGSATKLRSIERSKLVERHLPLLHQCVTSIGSVQVRNMGTLGGNICNASPAADGALGLMALDATAHITGLDGERDVLVMDFFKGPGLHILKEDEILTGVTVPIPGLDTGYHFISIGRMALDISTISVAVSITLRDGVVETSRICLGSVAPVPLRLEGVEDYLMDRELTLEVIKEAALRASKEIKPIDDLRASAQYRRTTAKGLMMEALYMAKERAEARR